MKEPESESESVLLYLFVGKVVSSESSGIFTAYKSQTGILPCSSKNGLLSITSLSG